MKEALQCYCSTLKTAGERRALSDKCSVIKLGDEGQMRNPTTYKHGDNSRNEIVVKNQRPSC